MKPEPLGTWGGPCINLRRGNNQGFFKYSNSVFNTIVWLAKNLHKVPEVPLYNYSNHQAVPGVMHTI